MRRLSIVVLITIVVVGAAELGARVLSDRLPVPLVWHSQEAWIRVANMERAGKADIVFVGSSLVAAGINPSLLEQELPGVTAHNAGLSAGVPSLTALWALDVVIPRLEPELLVVGVSSFDFYDHPSGIAFRDAYLSSPGGRYVSGPRAPIAAVHWWLAEHTALWRHRRELAQPSVLLDAILGRAAPIDEIAEAVTPTGWATFPGTPRFNPADPGRGGGLPAQDWHLGTREPSELERLILEAKKLGIDVVMVLMPTTNTYVDRHPNGEEDHRRYADAAEDLAERTSTPLVRLDDIRDDDLFGDAVHLNRDGAEKATSELAEKLADMRPRVDS